MTNTVKQQILAIRATGETNMFDVNRVQHIATAKATTSWWCIWKATGKSTPTSSSRGKSTKYADFHTSDLLSEAS